MKGYPAQIPVRFSDLDVFGHVNHTRYLTYCEDHRTVMFAHLGRDTGSWLLATGFAVAQVECCYLWPVGLDDQAVDVTCAVEALGRSSIRLFYELHAQNRLVAWVRTTLVLTSAGNARPMTDSERNWMSQYVGASSLPTRDRAGQ